LPLLKLQPSYVRKNTASHFRGQQS